MLGQEAWDGFLEMTTLAQSPECSREAPHVTDSTVKLELRGERDEVRSHCRPHSAWKGFGLYAKRAGKSLMGFEKKSDTLAAAWR